MLEYIPKSMDYSATVLCSFDFSDNEKEKKRYDVTKMIHLNKQKAAKMRKKEFVHVLRETDLDKGGSHSLLSMCLYDLQQKAEAFSIDVEHVATQKRGKILMKRTKDC